MKQILLYLMLLVLPIVSFSQQAQQAAMPVNTDYLKKSKTQKTAAWIITGAGSMGLLVTALADASQETSGALVTFFSLGTVEPTYKSYTGLYLASAALTAVGISFFITSANNKKKAISATTSFKMEKSPTLQNGKLSSHASPALSLKINLTK
ncbi:MAG TPA: hypothetical protein VI548_04175 [Chitinophagaceae bacterium]|nr:hypothetical protein [Chitinophagaceae bacterium]